MFVRRGAAGLVSALVAGWVAQGAVAATIGEPGGSGSWPAVVESRSELPMHTLYHPQRWPDKPVPLYVWGNGGCSANGLSHQAYLTEIASHGYLVVALGAPDTSRQGPRAGGPAPGGAARSGAAPGAAAPGAPPPGSAARGAVPPGGPGSAPAQPSQDPTTPAQMMEAIEWATRENARAGGEFRNRIDLTHIAVGGHSCGGLQALAVSHDPRINTTLVLDSGIYIRPGGRSGVAIDKTQLARLHGPVLYLIGGPSDIAYENALDDFARQDKVPVMIANLPVGHGGTFSQPNGGDWARVTTRWLDWQLKNDADAGLDFLGTACRLCTDSRWTVQQKRMPAPAAR